MTILTDEEINALQHLGGGISPRAIESAVLSKLAAGVSVEPEFKWCSVLRELPEEQSYVMVCFGVDVVEGSYGSGLWLSLACGEAQPDYWAYHPKPPHHKRDGSMYTLDQLTQAYAAGRAAGLSAEPVGYTYTIRDVAHGAIDDQTLKAGTPLYTKEEL